MLNRLKNTNSSTKPSKSLGDSIKRHIFHKSLVSKSGTKQHRSSPSTVFNVSGKQFCKIQMFKLLGIIGRKLTCCMLYSKL